MQQHPYTSGQEVLPTRRRWRLLHPGGERLIIPEDELKAHFAQVRELQRTADPKTLRALKALQAHHQCSRCGKCCSEPVGMLGREAIAIARHLGIPASEFRARYIERQRERWLQLRQVEDRCPFLERDGNGHRCSIYVVRPEVCRRFPFLTIQVIGESKFPGIAVDDELCPNMRRTFDAVTGGRLR